MSAVSSQVSICCGDWDHQAAIYPTLRAEEAAFALPEFGRSKRSDLEQSVALNDTFQ